jgi:hypothetical protein
MSQSESPVRIQVYVSPECAARLSVRARREGRSVSAMAARLLDAALGSGPIAAHEVEKVRTLGEGEPGGGSGFVVGADVAPAMPTGVSPSPSVERDAAPARAPSPPRVTGAAAKCPMDVPVGVKCKVCGQVHTPKSKR